jgi:cobalamin biosynthesis Mg chelatase CobN
MSEERPRPGSANPGLGVDSEGNPVLDPTKNVLDLVEAAIKRQDDLREAESRHVREVASLRAEYQAELRQAETDRINAIRAVDVQAVQQAATVAETRATALANQVAASAEAMRSQVAAAAGAAATSLAAALEPVQKDIADLRRAQYEAQGQKTQVVEARSQMGGTTTVIAAVIAAMVFLVGLYAATRRTPAVVPTPTVTVTTPATGGTP